MPGNKTWKPAGTESLLSWVEFAEHSCFASGFVTKVYDSDAYYLQKYDHLTEKTDVSIFVNPLLHDDVFSLS